MALAQIQFHFIGTGITWVPHTGIPAWDAGNNYTSTSNWAPVADVNHSNYWINDATEQFFMQFGGNGNGWASARFISYRLALSGQTENSDGSIDLTWTATLGHFKGHPGDGQPGGKHSVYDIKLNGRTEWHREGDSGDSFDIAPNTPTVTGTAHIEAGADYNGAILLFHTEVEGFSPDEFSVGFKIHNPNPPTYVPMAIRKSGTYQSLNTHHGFIRLRAGGSWHNRGEENLTTSKHQDTGHNRIRRSGHYLQLPPM